METISIGFPVKLVAKSSMMEKKQNFVSISSNCNRDSEDCLTNYPPFFKSFFN